MKRPGVLRIKPKKLRYRALLYSLLHAGVLVAALRIAAETVSILWEKQGKRGI